MAIRATELLVIKALSDPAFVQSLQNDPTKAAATLKALTLPAPDTRTSNAIWLTVVIGFVLVLIASAAVLVVGLFSKLEANAVYAVESETILTIFTTAGAFLAGLFAPSPVKKEGE